MRQAKGIYRLAGLPFVSFRHQLLALPASSGERLCNCTVSVCLSVTLSANRSQQRRAAALQQLGRRQQSIDICRRYRSAAASAGSVNAAIRGRSTQTWVFKKIFVDTQVAQIFNIKTLYKYLHSRTSAT